jgi:TrmH family RNA methyltransferase
MLSRNDISHIHSLRTSKFRKLYGEFIAEGQKLVGELLRSSFDITGIYAVSEWVSANDALLKEKNIPIHEIREMELERISNLTTPNEVLATVKIPVDEPFSPDKIEDLVLVLDRIQDPGNLGTIIRTADWFGLKTIICSEDTADVFNPKVVQSTMGSLIRVKLHYTDLVEFLRNISGSITVYGSMSDGDNLFKEPIKRNSLVIIGNESKGISPALVPFINMKIGIPGATGRAESLNASIAAAVICAEFRRQNP